MHACGREEIERACCSSECEAVVTTRQQMERLMLCCPQTCAETCAETAEGSVASMAGMRIVMRVHRSMIGTSQHGILILDNLFFNLFVLLHCDQVVLDNY